MRYSAQFQSSDTASQSCFSACEWDLQRSSRQLHTAKTRDIARSPENFYACMSEGGRRNIDTRNRLVKPGLPYLNNLSVVLLTVAVNMLCLFVFQYGRELTLGAVLADAATAGCVTSFIDVCVARRMLDRLKKAGVSVTNAPVVGWTSRLPKNPLALSLVFAAVFGLLTPLGNLLIIRFYQIGTFTFARFSVWKLIYSCLLSEFILEWAVLRYVQPDCMTPAAAGRESAGKVINPLGRVSAAKEVFNSAVTDFGTNLITGLFLGGTVVRGGEVVLMPVTSGGAAITGVIFGVIITFMMVWPVAKKIKAALAAPCQPPARAGTVHVITWLPSGPLAFALALLPAMVVLCTLVFGAVFRFSGFAELNFFQFFFIRLIFVSLLSKGVVLLAVRRWTQA